MAKGETLLDTVRNIEAMGADALVVRHPPPARRSWWPGACAARVINAGDGAHEHPTQALLDCLHPARALGRAGRARPWPSSATSPTAAWRAPTSIA